MNPNKLSAAELLSRLTPPSGGKLNIVLDTDTYNEIDDQFAVVYALQSQERLRVNAIYAAPFHNRLATGPDDGMEKSYEEILRILEKLDVPAESFAFRGSTRYLSNENEPVHSPAAADLVERANRMPAGELLYVVSIGAPTNVASAILMDPGIIGKIVVVWLGGHSFQWPHTKEFNLKQDLAASRILFDSGVPLVQIPCFGVASHLITTLAEMEHFVKGRGAIGEYLYETFRNCRDDHFAYSRVIWDISAIAWLINNAWVPTELAHSPILTDQYTWSFDASRHFIRYASFVHRDLVFKDLFGKLTRGSKEQ